MRKRREIYEERVYCCFDHLHYFGLRLACPLDCIWANFLKHWISETYFKNFTLAKDVVFDEPEIVEFYGGPIMFPAGTRVRSRKASQAGSMLKEMSILTFI